MKTIAASLLCCLAPAFAQHAHPSAAPSARPVALYPGLGPWTHPIATANPLAQKFFNQGLILLYGFNRPEALRSFQKAAELDPAAAMPRWGIAMSTGPYINMDGDPEVNLTQSCEAVQAGFALKVIQSTEREWLEAAATRCPDFKDPQAYVTAMKALAARHPDDPDAQTFYADALMIPIRWRWYDARGNPGDGILEAERVLEATLRRFPDHPGANHLYIHAVESSPTPERAIPSAERLMGFVPAAGHLVHMPGHIWLATGDYEKAAIVNESASAIDRRFFEQTGVHSGYFLYYLHNLQFIVYARAMQGRVAPARAAWMEMQKGINTAAAAMPEMADVMNGFVAMEQLRLQLWDEVLQGPKPAGINDTSRGLWHMLRGFAYAGKGQRDAALTEQAAFEASRRKIPRDAPWGSNKMGDVMDFASAALIARLEPDPATSVAKWRKAVELQDALLYDEPPAWYYPVRESLGAALLRSGKPAEAEEVFREGLRRSPNNGRLLFGLLESLKAQNKTEPAQWVEREYTRAWKGADLKLRVADL